MASPLCETFFHLVLFSAFGMSTNIRRIANDFWKHFWKCFKYITCFRRVIFTLSSSHSLRIVCNIRVHYLLVFRLPLVVEICILDIFARSEPRSTFSNMKKCWETMYRLQHVATREIQARLVGMILLSKMTLQDFFFFFFNRENLDCWLGIYYS